MYELDCPFCNEKLSATTEQLGRQTICPRCDEALLIQLPGDVLPEIFDMELGPEPTRVFAREMPPPPSPSIDPTDSPVPASPEIPA